MIKTFEVRGSASEPYKIIFEKKAESVGAFCSCPAGKNGSHCKHRISIMRGDATKVTSDNHDEVAEIAVWISGTEIEQALDRVLALELKALEIKKELSSAKKNLAKAMRG